MTQNTELTQNTQTDIPNDIGISQNILQQTQGGVLDEDDMSDNSSNEELTQENKELKDQIEKLVALENDDIGKEGTRSGDRKKRGNDIVRKIASKLIKKRVWPNTKFVTSYGQLNQLCDKVWDLLPKAKWGYTEENKTQFMNLYRDYFGTVINTQRTTVHGALKDKAWKWMDENFAIDETTNKKTAVLPTVNQITRCSLRDIDATMHDVFDWYVDSLLPCVVGNQYDFSESKRLFQRCSEVTLPKSDGKKVITSSTEAFLVVCWENYRKKWMNHWLWRQDNPGNATLPNPRHKNGVFPNPPVDELYATRWTNTDNGSTVLGGWHHDGKVAYKTALTAVKDARNQVENVRRQEDLVCERLRKKYKVTAQNEEEYNTKKRKSEPTACKVQEIDFGEESE